MTLNRMCCSLIFIFVFPKDMAHFDKSVVKSFKEWQGPALARYATLRYDIVL